MKKTRNSNRDKIKKKIEELLTKQNKKEEISHLKKQIKEYKRSSGRSSGSSKLFEPQLNTLENDYKIQQELKDLLTEPVITDERINYYKPLVKKTIPSQQLFQTLLDKKQFIDDAKLSEIKIIDELEKLKEKEKKNFDDTLKLRETISIYENNPYRDMEKLEKFTADLLDIEKHFLTSKISETYFKTIDLFFRVSQYDDFKAKVKENKFIPIPERNFLLSLIAHKETLLKKRIATAEPIEKELAKTHNAFQSVADIKHFEKIYNSYKASNYNELHILNQASAFFAVLQHSVLPVLQLKEIEDFLNGKQTFKKRDIEMLKTMLDDIPLNAFDNFITRKNKLEFFQIIYTHLSVELEVEMEKKEADKGNIHSDVVINLQSSQTSTTTTSTSQSDREGISLLSRLRKQKIGNQKIRDLLLEQPLRGIPVILIGIHGSIGFKEGICNETFSSPLDVLFRMITTAPGETTTNRVVTPEYANLLNNKVIRNPEKTINDALNERKENTSLDKKINKFRKTGDGIATNINFKNRNHLVINYKNTQICKKYYSKDSADTSMGVHVLNTTQHLPFGMNLMFFKPFMNFLNLPEDLYDYYNLADPETKYAGRFTNKDIYDFLKHLGYKQAVILDGACENNNYIRLPKFSEETTDAIATVQALLNVDEDSSRILVKLLEKWILREDPAYKTHKQETKKIGQRALQKSKHHRATIAKDNRGKR